MSKRIAIVGRPNVGKSTLFNRLTGSRSAIVDDTPGITRDRKEGTGSLSDLTFSLTDTAGYEMVNDASLESRMRQQTEQAIKDADVIIFMIDGKHGIIPLDEQFARILRRTTKPILLVANKCDTKKSEENIHQYYALGFGEPIQISSEHGLGLGNLYDALQKHIDRVEEDTTEEKNRHLQVGIVGRPNVGKSTLINAILGEDRVLTGPEAGITRDSISVELMFKDKPLRLIDTAGLRKRARVMEKIEKISAIKTYETIKFAEVVILVIDGTMPLEKQDLIIAKTIIDEGRALVLAINKWDLVTHKKEILENIHDRLDSSLTQVRGVPIVTLSALTGKNITKLLQATFDIYEMWNRRLPTAQINRWLDDMTQAHPPPLVAGKRIKIKYMTQIKSRPPTFAAFVNKALELPESYIRYLINGLRESFGLTGVPIRIYLRKSENPYDNSDEKNS